MPDQKTYADSLKVKDALIIYFEKYHFANGGYDDKFFRIKVGPIFIPVPNTEARIKAVKIHDIHHLLTEYTALWKGEIEIGAWEIASGCGSHFVAWLLNFASFSIGLFIYPRALYKAFMKGLAVKSNLYREIDYDENLLTTKLGELRQQLGINNPSGFSAKHILYFLFWLILSLSLYIILIIISDLLFF